MSEHNDTDSECPSEGWLSPWEMKCLDEWEKESVIEERIQMEKEKVSQKMWQSFQNSATAVAGLFKDGSQGCISLWGPFQGAAGSVTLLYRDCQDSVRRSFELGTQVGVNRRTRELLAWTKRRRRRIARDDLIAYLCGKAAPGPRHRIPGPFSKTPMKSASATTTGAKFDGGVEPDLQLFQDALAVHGLSGAMSNVSVGRRHTPSLPTNAAIGAEDYHGFLLEQIAHHNSSRKRCASGNMDTVSPSSPSHHKRFRIDDDADL